MGNSFYFLYQVYIAGTNFFSLGLEKLGRCERKTGGKKLQKTLYYCCESLLQMPSFSSLEENLGWQSRVPDYYLSDPDMPPPGWHDYEPASSVQLHAESGSEPDIWSAPWWLYPPVIIHSSVYSTVKYVIVQRIVYSSVKYEIVHRTLYSTVYCKVCDNS